MRKGHGTILTVARYFNPLDVRLLALLETVARNRRLEVGDRCFKGRKNWVLPIASNYIGVDLEDGYKRY